MFDFDTNTTDEFEADTANLDEVFADDHAEAWAWATDDVADIRFS